jgi:hypothetical protein
MGSATGANGATGAVGAAGKADGKSQDHPFTIERVQEPGAVRFTIDAALTSKSPQAACGTYVTSRYVNSAYGSDEGCAQAVKGGGAASDVDVSDIQVNGKSASATAVPNGGANDGEKLQVQLVNEGGPWKVDQVESNVPVGP